MRLLLVEDDHSLAAGLDRALQSEGYAVDAVATGEAALFLLAEADFDAVVLDRGLPDMDGLDVLRQLRKRWARLPVLLLTARDSLEDRVAGLDTGADDYVTKPFDVPELVARLRAMTRRAAVRIDSQLTVGQAVLNLAGHKAQLAGEPVPLSGKEYALLATLMENAGRLLTRSQLEGHLYAYGEETSSNAVEVHIHNLRRKFGKDFIKTVRGIGYGVGMT